MAHVLYLLLAEPDVLFHTSLLLSNLLLVLDQVLRHLPKFRLQSPPDKSHEVIGSALLQLTKPKVQCTVQWLWSVETCSKSIYATSLSCTISHARPWFCMKNKVKAKKERCFWIPEVFWHLLGLWQDCLNSICGDKVFIAVQAHGWHLSLQRHCSFCPHLLCRGFVSCTPKQEGQAEPIGHAVLVPNST